jgi:hypothetical protein
MALSQVGTSLAGLKQKRSEEDIPHNLFGAAGVVAFAVSISR